jgi:hypothetical protein
LHFVGTRLKEVVSSRAKALAYRVQRVRGEVVQVPLKVRYLGNSR